MSPTAIPKRPSPSIVKIVLILVGILVILLVVFFALNSYIRHQELTGGQQPKACTQEAKICPDGSTVSRQGPNCEFKECPGS